MLNEIPGLYKLHNYISEEPWDLGKRRWFRIRQSNRRQISEAKHWECNQFQRVKTVNAIKELFSLVLMNSDLGNKTLILNGTTACKLISVVPDFKS